MSSDMEAFRRLVFVARVFALFDDLQDRLQLRRVVVQFEAERLRLEHDIAAAGEIADQDVTLIPDQFRIDVFVAGSEFLHGVHMRAALCAKAPNPPTAGAD